MKKYLLFDLDGTLTDPKIGITTCVKYALESFGIEETDQDKLEEFIGPPLLDSFMEFYGMDEETAKQAVAKYRERFSTVGKFENMVYPGMHKMLQKLQAHGVHMAIASSKPTVFVKEILQHFGLDRYFRVAVGSELDGTRSNKQEVVEEALRQLFHGYEVKREEVFMIGDRKFDVEGAKAQGIESVGVAYGYGSVQELMEAHADYVVRSVEELESFLLRTDSDERKLPTLNQRILTIAANCLIFYIAKLIGGFVVGTFLFSLCNSFPGLQDFLMQPAAEGEGYLLSGNGNAIANIWGVAIAVLFVYKTWRYSLKKTKREHYLSHLKKLPYWQYMLAGFGCVFLAIGLNCLLDISGLTAASQAYQETSAMQYSASLGIGLLYYGIVAPFAEEIVYRGIIYGYCRRCFGILQGILLSTVLFSVFHFNMVQGLYAFIMGFVFAYAYEYFGSFLVPVVLHMLANTLAYLLTDLGIYEKIATNLPICILSILVGAVSIGYLIWQKKRILKL